MQAPVYPVFLYGIFDSWVNFFQYAGIPSTEANQYAQIFIDNRIADPQDLSKEILIYLDIKIPSTKANQYAQIFIENKIADPQDLSEEIFMDLGIKIVGDRLAILKCAKALNKGAKPQSEPPQ